MKPIYYLGQINFVAKETLINNIYEQFFMLDKRQFEMSSFLYFGLAPLSLVGVSLLIIIINTDIYMIFTHSERIFNG